MFYQEDMKCIGRGQVVPDMNGMDIHQNKYDKE